MVTEWVVDASIATKLVVLEADSDEIRALVSRLIEKGPLLAPPLIRYEVGNAVTKHGKAPDKFESELEKALAVVRRVDPVDVTRFASPLSYYDASYLALAVEQKAGLLTADEKLRKAARKQGIVVAP